MNYNRIVNNPCNLRFLNGTLQWKEVGQACDINGNMGLYEEWVDVSSVTK